LTLFQDIGELWFNIIPASGKVPFIKILLSIAYQFFGWLHKIMPQQKIQSKIHPPFIAD
jgi:hypothetical protein